MLTYRRVNECETTSPHNMVTDIIYVPGQHTLHTMSGCTAPVVCADHHITMVPSHKLLTLSFRNLKVDVAIAITLQNLLL